jgi:hypothetical protein
LNVKGLDDALVRGVAKMVSDPFTVRDERGSLAILGQAYLETPHSGETHVTSATSLVLFDKDKTVIWKAP